MSRFAFTAEIVVEAEDIKAAETLFHAFMAKGIDGEFIERYTNDWPEALEPRPTEHGVTYE